MRSLITDPSKGLVHGLDHPVLTPILANKILEKDYYSEIDESIKTLSYSKIRSANDYIREQAAAEMLKRYSSEAFSDQD